jgi:ABC-type microcin C transport system permease subunit YejE
VLLKLRHEAYLFESCFVCIISSFFFLLLIALVAKFFHAGFLFLLTQTLVFQFMKVVSDEASFCASYGA